MSFRVSTIAIVFVVQPVIFAAFILAYSRFLGRKLIISIFSALLSVPAVVVGLTLFILLSRQGTMGDFRLLFTQIVIALETSMGIFFQGIALGIVLMLLSFLLNAFLHSMEHKTNAH